MWLVINGFITVAQANSNRDGASIASGNHIFWQVLLTERYPKRTHLSLGPLPRNEHDSVQWLINSKVPHPVPHVQTCGHVLFTGGCECRHFIKVHSSLACRWQLSTLWTCWDRCTTCAMFRSAITMCTLVCRCWQFDNRAWWHWVWTDAISLAHITCRLVG